MTVRFRATISTGYSLMFTYIHSVLPNSIKVYEVLVEMSGNFSMHHDFSAGMSGR
jgi:hypothetical protein